MLARTVSPEGDPGSPMQLVSPGGSRSTSNDVVLASAGRGRFLAAILRKPPAALEVRLFDGKGWTAPVPLGEATGLFAMGANRRGDAAVLWTDYPLLLVGRIEVSR